MVFWLGVLVHAYAVVEAAVVFVTHACYISVENLGVSFLRSLDSIWLWCSGRFCFGVVFRCRGWVL